MYTYTYIVVMADWDILCDYSSYKYYSQDIHISITLLW